MASINTLVPVAQALPEPTVKQVSHFFQFLFQTYVAVFSINVLMQLIVHSLYRYYKMPCNCVIVVVNTLLLQMF